MAPFPPPHYPHNFVQATEIYGDTIAWLIAIVGDGPKEIRIFNWKTGAVLLVHISITLQEQPYLTRFVFADHNTRSARFLLQVPRPITHTDNFR